jgi:two-component system response regulator YesN
MNILIIDDQQEVVDGIIVGVDWEKLNITQCYKANDIFMAKDIIKENNIHLMLCDIEMPLGTGLELYEWVNENDYDIKCIFLTAHSEFSYAQKAVHLQGFDYLLQPVTYKEIESSLQRAINQIKIDNIIKNYYEYGIELKKHEMDTLNSLLREYLLGLKIDVKEVIDYMAVLSMKMEPTTMCESMLIQILSWEDYPKRMSMLLYTMDNVLKHLLASYVPKMLLVGIDKNHFYLLYEKNESVDRKEIH